MKVFACVLLAVAAQAAPAPEADPALLYGAYAGLPYAGVYGAGVYGYPYAAAVAPALTYAVKPLELKTDVTATNLPVPVAIGGYKAEAGNNGDLVGAVHEVPGLLPAPALLKQENTNGGALTVGTSAVVSHSFVKREAEADPALLYGGLPYAGVYGAGVYGYPYAAAVAPALTYAVKPLELKTDVTATNLPVPVAIGGYKAEAGNNGDLVGAVHEVPGLLPAPALLKQENSNGGALTVGTSAVVSHSFVKREAEAEPALLYGGLPYAGVYGAGVYGYPYAAAVAPAVTYAVKPLELKTEVTATNLPVPVAIGGYKAEAGNNGDLVGAVHEVPGLLPAPALFKQENGGAALTVGTSAVVSHSFVKREAEAEADPALLYGAYGYAGLGYAGYGYRGLGYAGYAGYPYTYGAYAGYPYYG